MATAASLTCPSCGAAASPEAHACTFCRTRLATVACPACFGMVFVGSRHCVHCGVRAREPKALDGTPWKCPDGHGELRGIALGGAEIGECGTCAGIWLDEATFQAVVSDRSRDSVVPQGGASDARPRPVSPAPVRYRRCPDCGKTMNRVNFARTSGVILDACRGHGTWCDADELRRVVEFVRAGGMDVARRRELEQLALERNRIEFARSLDATMARSAQGPLGAASQRRDDLGAHPVGVGLSFLFALLRD
jgi:Zn-finger nucleic acid-binding protein